MHPKIKNVTFTPTGKTAADLQAIRAKAPPVLKDWTARRSGAAQTVDGFGADGEPVKITDVHRVKRAGGKTFALDARGAVVAHLAD